MWFVVGLGNPGGQYEDTRHNVGFLVVDEVARRYRLSLGKAQLGATTARGDIAGTAVLLAQPQAFMNRSGGPAGALQRFYKIPVERVLVVHDDLDLPLGTVRVKRGGGHGGHNGLRDLHAHLGAGFARVRVGISRPPPQWDSADYVLGRWSDEERQVLSELVDAAADAVEAVLADGLTSAMNRFNVRPRRPKAEGKKTEDNGSGEPRLSQDSTEAAPLPTDPTQSTAPNGARS